MVICLERDADLHMAQLMPLPLTVSCFSKIQVGFTFLVLAHLGSPGKKWPLNGGGGCACMRACVTLAVCNTVLDTGLMLTMWKMDAPFIRSVPMNLHRPVVCWSSCSQMAH